MIVGHFVEGIAGGDVIEVLECYLEPRTYRAGQVLWAEGEVSGRLTLLDEGRVKALRARPDGRSVLLYVFGPGDIFGFLPFLDGGPYPATAVAIDEVRARVMSRSELRGVIARDPQVAMVLLSALGQRLRDAFERVDDQGRRDATARVAAALLLLLPAGVASGSLTVIEVPSPLYAFAEDMGLTPETFSRALSRLVEHEVLHRLGPGKLQVLDLPRLRRIASGSGSCGPKSRNHRS